MYTVEMEQDCTVITTLDEGGAYDDVIVCIDETSVFISQVIPDTDRNQVLELSYQQLLDIVYSMNSSEGAYYQRRSLL